MGFLEILTIVFVILKATNHLDWSWWLVFAPEYPALLIYAVIALGMFGAGTVGLGVLFSNKRQARSRMIQQQRRYGRR